MGWNSSGLAFHRSAVAQPCLAEETSATKKNGHCGSVVSDGIRCPRGHRCFHLRAVQSLDLSLSPASS